MHSPKVAPRMASRLGPHGRMSVTNLYAAHSQRHTSSAEETIHPSQIRVRGIAELLDTAPLCMHACACKAVRFGFTSVQIHCGLEMVVAEPVNIPNTDSGRPPQPSRAMYVHSARRLHHQLATTCLWLPNLLQRTTFIDGADQVANKNTFCRPAAHSAPPSLLRAWSDAANAGQNRLPALAHGHVFVHLNDVLPRPHDVQVLSIWMRVLQTSHRSPNNVHAMRDAPATEVSTVRQQRQ